MKSVMRERRRVLFVGLCLVLTVATLGVGSSRNDTSQKER
jgi:hypothetical protein